MLKRANIPWTCKTLCRQIEKGNLTFDCAVQRKPSWDLGRKSLLIHSLIDGYPVPAFFFARNKSGYDALDGKQRSLAMKEFVEGTYRLTDDTPDVTDEEGYPCAISGLYFSELPEWVRDNILDFSLTIYYFEEITEDEIRELFFRINNGKPLTAIELTRVKAKSLTGFQEIAHHDMIASSISEAGKKSYFDEQTAMQIWTLCFTDHRDFTTKSFRPFISSAEVTKEHVIKISEALNYQKVLLDSLLEKNTKEAKRVVKKLKTRSHIVSNTYVAYNAIKAGISQEKYNEIIYHFFDTSKTSINEDYNRSVRSGSAKAIQVEARIKVLNSLLKG